MNILGRAWHFVTDARFHESRTSRLANFWAAWQPYLGFHFDVSARFTPAHEADAEIDASWGSDFKLDLGLLWFDCALTIPNENHPDNVVEFPARYCPHCGRETEPRISDHCPGCNEPAPMCSCRRVVPYSGFPAPVPCDDEEEEE